MRLHTDDAARSPAALRGVAAVVAALVIAGCGTTSEQEPASSTADAAPSGTVDISALDVGNYPTEAQPPLGAANSERAGRQVEGRRMADFVVGPWDIDASLTESYSRPAVVLQSPNALVATGPQAVADAAGRHAFVTGFASSRQSADTTVLQNVVVEFADEAAAAAAATEMADAALAEPTSGASRTRVPVPGHAEALTSVYPFTDPAVGREQYTVRSLSSRGRFVLMQVAQSYNGLDAALDMITRTLDAQNPLIDQFAPTPVADLAALPLDPSGLLAKTILVPAADANVMQNWAYGPRGALHFQSEPVATTDLFAETGTDLIATGETTVYRTTDGPAATTLAEALVDQVAAQQGTAADPVAGLPDSRCVESTEFGFYCAATVDRYTIESQSTQIRDAHQRLAAQYALLAG